MEIAIYNTKEKELIGVFRNIAIASRYIFSNHSKYNANRILNCFERKGKLIENLIFDFPVTVRRANDKHLKLLNDSDVYISEGYPKMRYYRIEGMKSCRTKMNTKIN